MLKVCFLAKVLHFNFLPVFLLHYSVGFLRVRTCVLDKRSISSEISPINQSSLIDSDCRHVLVHTNCCIIATLFSVDVHLPSFYFLLAYMYYFCTALYCSIK